MQENFLTISGVLLLAAFGLVVIAVLPERNR
jgi:hypothetical protein